MNFLQEHTHTHTETVTVTTESGMWCSIGENQRNTNSQRSDIETTTTQFN